MLVTLNITVDDADRLVRALNALDDKASRMLSDDSIGPALTAHLNRELNDNRRLALDVMEAKAIAEHGEYLAELERVAR